MHILLILVSVSGQTVKKNSKFKQEKETDIPKKAQQVSKIVKLRSIGPDQETF